MSPRVLSTARPLLHCNLKRVGAGKEISGDFRFSIVDCRLAAVSTENRPAKKNRGKIGNPSASRLEPQVARALFKHRGYAPIACH